MLNLNINHLFFVLLLSFPSISLAENISELVLNDTNESPYTNAKQDGFVDIIANEAFKRAGLKIRLEKLPSERALINANAGIIDGEISRVAGIEQQYPNLIRVPEKLYDIEFSAFSKNKTISGTPESIRQHTAGYIRGWKLYEKLMADAPKINTAEDPTQLFRLLSLDRIEIALYPRWMGLSIIREQNLLDIYVLEPPLASREIFIYLNKRHAQLVPKIAEAIRSLKNDGFYDKAYREKVLPFAKK